MIEGRRKIRMGRRKALEETLRRRVEAMYPAHAPDEIVNHLRSTYPDYHRMKHKTLIRFVQEALRSHDCRKKRKKIGEEGQGRPFTSSESDGDNGTPSELSYDLTKTMLRNSYMANSNSIVNELANVTMFRDLGGIKKVKEEVNRMLLPIYHPHLARELGVRPTSGILLHGPPGCGKTRLAHAIANETRLPFYPISPGQLVSASGDSEQNIRDLFSKAYTTAPSIIFIDEIDAIASKREDLTRQTEKRIVTQLLTCMDQPHNHNYVLVIGATNRPHDIDPALRRPGRFAREIFIGYPDDSSREEILSVLTRNVKLDPQVDLPKIAKSTPAFSASDLQAVLSQAGELAMERIVRQRNIMRDCPEDNVKEPLSQEQLDKAAIKMSDLEEAVKLVQPSARREGFHPIPDVKWEDVGGLDLLRQEFDDYIISPIKYPEDYEGFGVDLKTGFLLYGPPGCGKTLIAKAVANAAGASYIHIKGPELLNRYVGESESEVRKIFNQARTCAPCILFFDELDALTTKRGKEGGWVTERLLNQLLIELDGGAGRRGVFVIGATNRPDVIDPALLRPGRLGRLVYIPLPTPDQRVLILKALARKCSVDASTDLSAIGRSEACENMSGADVAFLMNEAAMAARKEKTASTDTTSCHTSTIKPRHFEVAFSRVFPSVSDKQKQYYEHLSERFSPSFHRNIKERNGREREKSEGNQSFGQEWKRGRKEKQ